MAPTRDQIKAILNYLDYFRNPKEPFYRLDRGGGSIDPYLYSDGVLDFRQALYHNGFIQPYDWGSWQKEAEEYVRDGSAALARVDLEIVVKLFTLHIRKDRFAGGHLAGMIDCGHILKLLECLERIEKEID